MRAVRAICALVFIAGTVTAFAGQAADDSPKAAETRKKLEKKISVDLADTSLAELADILREKVPGLGVRLDTAGGVSRNLKITYAAKDKPLAAILDAMFQKNDHGYVVISKEGDAYDGTILIKKGKERGFPLGEEPAKSVEKPKKTSDAKKMAVKKSEPSTRTPEQDASGKLQLARELLKDGKKDKAKPRLEDIVKKYPDTKAAEQARQLLKEMEP